LILVGKTTIKYFAPCLFANFQSILRTFAVGGENFVDFCTPVNNQYDSGHQRVVLLQYCDLLVK